MERWQSGLMYHLGKVTYAKVYREFESPSLRHFCYQFPRYLLYIYASTRSKTHRKAFRYSDSCYKNWICYHSPPRNNPWMASD